MKKKIIAIAMTAMMAFSFTGCADGSVSSGKTDKENNNVEEFVDSGKLELIKQDGEFTQEQLLSRIKAERLIENGGYRDSDEITAIVTLPSNSLVETFNEGAYESYNSVAQYASSSAGKVEAQAIVKKQNGLISELKSKGLIYSVEHNYKTVANAIAVTMPYGNMEAVKAVAGVESVVLCDTYNRPQSVSVDDVNSIVNNVDVYEDTGIFNSGAIDKDGDGKGDYDGNGTAVAILDSGFDCSHTVFQNSNVTKPVFTEANLAQVIDKTNAAETTPGLAVSDVYYSKKIPYMYDYADKDSDVFPYDSEHGTHVAGIIGGNDSVITGIAVNTQLVLMKVFPDLQEGANTDDILAALEDATLLQVDAINMSLGSSCGFAREVDEIWINEVYDNIKESGISLITAASNSYSSGFGGSQGNTSKVSNPDSGTVGSPSTYDAALSVASISGVKSKYLVGNDEHVLFFNESNNVAGKPNDFVKELFAQQNITDNEAHTFEYITVPGVGLATSYTSIKDQVAGKIALIRRGSNTFEEKAQIAKAYGAIACIIYNNIEGDILMSMGKSDHIPTISISKDDGVRLAEHDTGTLKIGFKQEAGPFMSDFSSWGPTPSLGIKPEITAHGGSIKSAVPGGGYEELSGTSMASPNLCGIVVLIRQYLKDKYPEMSAQEYSKLCNQLLMSSATIIKNQEGNPYSPRKQGAGLASLYNAVTTKAIIEVDGQDRPKLELGDDKGKTGVYTLEFSVKNLSSDTLNYTVALDGMTESVSTSDDDFVAEKAYMLNGNTKVSLVSGDARLKGNTLTVNGGATAKIKIVYSLSNADKNYIISSFPYGMYVEGFVKLMADNNTEINLNAPFLAFFGDWTEAPLFDKTYYEVESEAHDMSIDEEDKLKADYFATTPYGSYFYNYIIPLGTYLYDIDLSKFDAIPASEEHIAMSDYRGAIDGISAVYAGLLRNAKEMVFTITDKVTGEVIYKHTDYNANKAYSLGGGPVPYFEYLKINSHSLGLVNNRQYEFKMQGKVDYGDDGGLSTNVRNTFSFDFYLDNEAPIIKDASYEKTYDRNLKKDRYYITLTIYDNQHVMSVSPIAFTSNSSYTFLTDEPIPVYSERGQDNKVRFEITPYMDALYSQSLIGSAMCFSVDDYALNTNFYICQLPGTRGDFKFTSNGQASGRPLSLISANVGDIVDLTEYLYSTDSTLDANKDYLKYLSWTTSNSSIIEADPVTGEFKNGEAVCLKAGRAQVTVMEYMDGKQATITINVKDKEEATASARQGVKKGVKSPSDPIESVNFTYFETKFAYSRAAQTSEIGATGSRNYISSVGGSVAFYPGESIKLYYDVKPWYVENNYTYTYSTSNASIVKVEQDGTVTALKEGTAIITLTVGGSNLRATIIVSVKSEFVIEDRILVAYKGLGGKVVIPDDEGILYIGSFAFCLYDTDNEIELPEDDYDANKIPQTNTSVTEVVIPEGVEEVQKYAFYNCSNLKSVQLPSTIKFVREYSFYNDEKLESINLGDVEVIGAHAFHGCKALTDVDLSECYSIGASGFEGCSALTSVDLSHLRNAGTEKVGGNLVGRTFKDCTSLETILFDLNGNTKLCREMFVNTAVKEVDIYEKNIIPTYLFAKNSKLESVTVHNGVLSVEFGAFCDCPLLSEVQFAGSVGILGEQAFYNTPELKELTLPDGAVEIGASCFANSGLETLVFKANTLISKLGSMAFADTPLTAFDASGSTVYNVAEEDALLVSKDGKTVILAAPGKQFGEITIAENYSNIASGAFAATDVTKVTFENDGIIIGDFAFSGCENLQSVVFSGNLTQNAVVGTRAFNACTNLTEVVNIDKLKTVGDYAFAATGLTEITLGEGATFGEGAFLLSKLTKVTVGKNSVFGAAAFERCSSLKKVIMPEDGGVHFGLGCFYSAISLTEIDLSKTDGIIESQTFSGCTALYEISLKGVEEIGNLAFADCGSLSSVTNTNGVKVIGEGAFARNRENGSAPKFAAINLSALQELGVGAFMGNSGLSQVELPEGLTAIPEYAFALCTNLNTVILPSTVTEIGTYAFRSCENIISINLEKVKFIGENAFYNAMTAALVEIDLSSLEKVEKGAFSNSAISGDVTADNLVEIGDNSFSKVYLNSFTAPKVKSIGVAAFYKTALMTEFVFGTDLEYIGSYAFLGCTDLKNFAFMDGGVKKYEGDMNSYATIFDGALYTKLASGKTELKSVPASLDKTTLTVMEGTARIDTYAGNANKNITKIVLPDSLRYIGNYAFNKYYNLETVEFNSFSAPVLETEYFLLTDGNNNIVEPDFFPEAKLAETAPGYGILHNQFDIAGWEMYYFTFKGLVGANNPITMVLPANVGSGYDGVIYEVYFGKVEYAERSEYVAMDEYTSAFVDYAKQIADLKEVLLSDEKLINNAVTMLNSLTQDLTAYGYTQAQADEMIKTVRDAKAKLTELQVSAGGKDFKNLLAKLQSLPAKYKPSLDAALQEISELFTALRSEDQMLIRETKEYANYQKLVQQSENYEGSPVGMKVGIGIGSAVGVLAIAAVAVVAVLMVKKRKGAKNADLTGGVNNENV